MSGPELLFSCVFHISLTPGAGALVPNLDVGTAATKAKTSDFAAERGGHIGYDATYDDVLYRLAVRAIHRTDLLAEQTTTLVDIGLITA